MIFKWKLCILWGWLTVHEHAVEDESGKKVVFSPSGNRTPVSRVTGGDTYHYTNEEMFVKKICWNFSMFSSCTFVKVVHSYYTDTQRYRHNESSPWSWSWLSQRGRHFAALLLPLLADQRQDKTVFPFCLHWLSHEYQHNRIGSVTGATVWIISCEAWC